jgi:hypothetical protein
MAVQSVVPGVQSVVPGVQSVVPGMAVQSVVPGVQSVVPGMAVQSVVPGMPVQSVVPGMAGVAPQMPVTPYVQPIGSRHPIEQNHLGVGIIPGSFNTLGGSPYGRISGIAVQPGLVGVTPGLATTNLGLDPSRYLQHVEILRNACQGAGTNEDDIVRVIASTTNPERALIRRLYTQKYNEDLVSRLQSELSGDFKDAAVGSFMTPTEYDAYCLNGAMKVSTSLIYSIFHYSTTNLHYSTTNLYYSTNHIHH